MQNYFATATARRAQMDARQSNTRSRELQRETLCLQLQKDKVLHSSHLKDDCLDRVRRNRHYKALADEQLMLDRIEQQRKEQECMRQVKLENEAAQLQMNKERDEIIRQERIRQSIRESSTELRDLEKKLRSAYMNAERAKQLEMKEFAHFQDQQKEQEYAAQMNNQLKHLHELELAQDQATLTRSKEHKASLETQLAEKEDKKRADMELFMQEKAIVDSLVQRIHEEDAEEQQRRLRQQQATKAFIDEYLRDREQWQAAEKRKIEAENERIAKYLGFQEARTEQMKQQKRAADDVRATVYKTLAQNIGKREHERQELEDLRTQLAEAEKYERDQENDRAQLQHRIQTRLDMIDAYKSQMEEKRVQREHDQELEDAFRHRMLCKLAEDARIDLLTRERKRAKQMEHKRQVDAMVDERRRLQDIERAQELLLRQKEKDLDEFRQRVIEQERQRLLRDHASKLLGFLPKGVLKDEKDLDLFDEEFRARFKQ